jgi:hypothetical protein
MLLRRARISRQKFELQSGPFEDLLFHNVLQASDTPRKQFVLAVAFAWAMATVGYSTGGSLAGTGIVSTAASGLFGRTEAAALRLF